MIRLISLQNFDGSWDLGVELPKVLGHTKQKLIDSIPDVGGETVRDLTRPRSQNNSFENNYNY